MGESVTIVINWGLVTGAAVILGWLFTTGAGLVGANLSATAKKYAAAGVSIVFAGYFAVVSGVVDVPPIGEDPIGFLYSIALIGTLTFKAAQQIYDRIWKPTASAVASKVSGLFS